MSYANGTTNYNLPQTVGTDKRDWSDTNQAFSDVDAALKAASDGASQAAEDITALTTRVGTAEDDILALKAEDISLDGRLDTAEGAISTLQLQVPDVRSDLEDMITAYNEATATSTHAYSAGDYFIYNDVLYKATDSIGIGDTIVPNTNCEATNVSTELLTIEGDVDDVKSALMTLSTTEKIIGTDTRGVTIYQKTLTGTISTKDTSGSRDIFDIPLPIDVVRIYSCDGVIITTTTDSENPTIEFGSTSMATNGTVQLCQLVNVTLHKARCMFDSGWQSGVTSIDYDITIKYTKS